MSNTMTELTYTMTVNPRETVALEFCACNGVCAIVGPDHAVVVYEMNGGSTLLDEVRGFANQQMAVGFAVRMLIACADQYERDSLPSCAPLCASGSEG